MLATDRITGSFEGGRMFRNKGWPLGGVLAPDELPSDPALPMLGLLLDVGAALPLLSRAAGSRPDSCSIRHVRYRPGRGCSVVYELFDGGTSRLALARAFGEAPSRRRLERWQRRAEGGEGSAPIQWLEDERVLLSEWPVDPRLRALPSLVGPGASRKRLRRLLRGTELSLLPDDPEVVSWKPGRSCLLSYRARPGSGSLERPLYVRVLRRGVSAGIARAMREVHARPDRRFGAAELLAHCDRDELVVHSSVPGRELAASLGEGGLSRQARRCGRALATIHSCPPLHRPVRTTGDELRSLESAARAAEPLIPEAVGALGRVLARAHGAGRRDSPNVLLHGDFSTGQVLVDGEGLSVIDFERAAAGDAAIDLGSFVARLELRGREVGVDEDSLSRAVDAFLEGHEEASGGAPEPELVDMHRRIAVARLGLQAVRHLRPGWRAEAARLVELAAS